MSSVNSATQGVVQPNTRQTGASGYKAASAEDSPPSTGDSVEISAEARRLQEGELELVSLMNPAKTMAVDSDEHKKFRALMDTVKRQKSGVMSRIESVLEKNGIDLAGLGKLKIEVDKSGRVVVGGIKNKNMAANIQKALNQEKGLAAEIAEYRKNEKELSRQVKDYTGCTLYQLTMTARGDVSEDIRSEVEQDGKYYMGADYYMKLGFLGSTRSFINADDVAALSFEGNIDFSGEISVMTDPEGEIRNAMDGMFGKIRDAFDVVNSKLLDSLEGAGAEVDGENISKRLLDANKASITVDSRGQVKVEGRLSDDDAINRRGLEIIERLAKEMLLEVGTNSYGVNLFTAASHGLIDRKMREEGGGSDARVVARMENGTVRDVYVASNHTENKLERQLQNMLKKASSHIRK